ncbi:c-type cytochrome [Bradyrhizobium sp. HKCCYLS2038]|uniref:c-type cytochrome n=1 Tax=unclassified Bradyrhizobium TaxID=2631580 RepID=UPI003EB7FC50
MKTAAIFAAVVVAAVLSPVAVAQQQDDGTAHSQVAQVDLGKTTFAQKCSHCHGPNMVNSGTITPDLRRFPDDQPRFVTTVKQGKNGRMPPWGDILSDDEITALWAYVSSRRTQ